tara:strand:- start:2952 stop:3059 length:108 start_codon:yes stop_codon:yes gene_type:complete
MDINPAVGGYIVGVVVGIVLWEALYRLLKKNGEVK